MLSSRTACAYFACILVVLTTNQHYMSQAAFASPFRTPWTSAVYVPVFLAGDYDTPAASSTFSILSSQMSADVVCLFMRYGVTTTTSTTLIPVARTVTNSSLIGAFQRIRNLNMDVMLQLELELTNDPSRWIGEIGATYSESDWNAFFRSYSNFVLSFARMAQDSGVRYITIAYQLDSTLTRSTQWTTLLSDLRAVFTGYIGYQASQNGLSGFSWFSNLDYIVAATAFDASQITIADISMMKFKWVEWVHLLRNVAYQYNTTFLLQLQYPSSQNGFQTPWAPSAVVDLTVQRNAYEAALETLYGQSGGWLSGVFQVQRNIYKEAGACTASIITEDKPANQVIQNWFSALPASPVCPLSVASVDTEKEFPIYTEGLSSPFWNESALFNNLNFSSKADAHTGTTSIFADLQAYGVVSISNLNRYNLAGFAYLEFWIKAASFMSMNVYFSTYDLGATRVLQINTCGYVQGGVLGTGAWQRVVVPFSDLAISGSVVDTVSFQGGYPAASFYLDDIRFLGQVPPLCEQKCSDHVACYGCASAIGCGWCESTMSCMEGDDLQPANNSFCPSWKTEPTQCALWTETTSNNTCSSYTTCHACTDDVFCGWCSSSSTCVAGTPTGAASGSICPVASYSYSNCHSCSGYLFDTCRAFNFKKWTRVASGTTGGGRSSSISPYNILYDNDTMILQITNTSYNAVRPSGAAYTSRSSFQYGRYSFKLKSSGVSGTHLVVSSAAVGQKISMEFRGSSRSNVIVDVLATGSANNNRVLALGFDASTGSHLYEVEWLSTGVTFFIDGTSVNGVTAGVLPSSQAQITIEFYSDSGFVPLATPVTAEIEWVAFCPAGCNCNNQTAFSGSIPIRKQSVEMTSSSQEISIIPDLPRNPEFTITFPVLPRYGVLSILSSNHTSSSKYRASTVEYVISQNSGPIDRFVYLVNDGTVNFLRVEVTLNRSAVATPTTGNPNEGPLYYPRAVLRMEGTLETFDQFGFEQTIADALGIPVSQIVVYSVTSGSVIVEFSFTSDAESLTQTLESLVNSEDPSLSGLGILSIQTVDGPDTTGDSVRTPSDDSSDNLSAIIGGAAGGGAALIIIVVVAIVLVRRKKKQSAQRSEEEGEPEPAHITTKTEKPHHHRQQQQDTQQQSEAITSPGSQRKKRGHKKKKRDSPSSESPSEESESEESESESASDSGSEDAIPMKTMGTNNTSSEYGSVFGPPVTDSNQHNNYGSLVSHSRKGSKEGNRSGSRSHEGVGKGGRSNELLKKASTGHSREGHHGNTPPLDRKDSYSPLPQKGGRSTTSGSPKGSNEGSAGSIMAAVNKSSWGIKFDDLRIEEEIGRGSFGQVYKGAWREAPVAIKTVLNINEKQLREFQQEADLMKALRPHPNVVLFQGLCIYNNQTMIVTEYLSGGNLYAYIHSGKSMKRELQFRFLKGIAAGMLHISSEGFVHRDLAARNILLTSSLEPKVSDFGMSRIVEGDQGGKTETNVGPLRWMAPESLTHNVYSTKSDVWAYGVTMFEIVERSEPYPGKTVAQVGVGVASGTFHLELNLEDAKKYKVKLNNLMQKCMAREPQDRLTWKDICQQLAVIEGEALKKSHSTKGSTASSRTKSSSSLQGRNAYGSHAASKGGSISGGSSSGGGSGGGYSAGGPKGSSSRGNTSLGATPGPSPLVPVVNKKETEYDQLSLSDKRYYSNTPKGSIEQPVDTYDVSPVSLNRHANSNNNNYNNNIRDRDSDSDSDSESDSDSN